MEDLGPKVCVAGFILVASVLGTIFMFTSMNQSEPAAPVEVIKPWAIIDEMPPPEYYTQQATNNTGRVEAEVVKAAEVNTTEVNTTKADAVAAITESTINEPSIHIPEIVIRIETTGNPETGQQVVYVEGQADSNDMDDTDTNTTQTGNKTQNGANTNKETGRVAAEAADPIITPRSVGAAPEGAILIPGNYTLDDLYSATVRAKTLGMLIQADIIIKSDTRAEVVGANPWPHKDSIALRGLEGVAVVNDIVRVTGQVLGISRDHYADIMVHVLHVADIP